MRYLLVMSAVVCAAVVSPATAWGAKGHAWICGNAVDLLPEGELREYMTREETFITQSSFAPDFQWKDGAIARIEGPEHYIDLEVISSQPTAEDLPRTRVEAGRLYTELRVSYRAGGFLPWRIEEIYLALVNAFCANPRDVAFFAGVLSHYAADATQPLHTTIHYDGRVDREVNGRKFLDGIHADYEISFVEDQNIEFRASSLAMARPAERLDDIFAHTVAVIFDSFSKVDRIYEVAEKHRGDDKYMAWDEEMGDMARRQLAEASSFVASLWLTAWHEAGRPKLVEAK